MGSPHLRAFSFGMGVYYIHLVRSNEGMEATPTATKLKKRFEKLANDLVKMIDEIPVGRNAKAVVSVIAPNYHWKSPSTKTQSLQLQLKRNYSQWFELVSLLFTNAPQGTSQKITDADKVFRKWLELGYNHSITTDKEKNKARCREEISGWYSLLDILSSHPYQELIGQ